MEDADIILLSAPSVVLFASCNVPVKLRCKGHFTFYSLLLLTVIDYIILILSILVNEQLCCLKAKERDALSAAKRIKMLLIERDKSVKDIAAVLEIAPQSVSNKLYRDSFTFDEVVKICNFLDADVQIVTRDTHKTF